MKIKEYKKELINLVKRLEEEHGVVGRIEIEHSANESMHGEIFDYYKIKIEM